jgi:hypothetical protein
VARGPSSGPGPPVHRGPIQGVRPPFDLGCPCPSDGPGRMWVAGRRPAPAAERRWFTGDLAGDGGLGATVHYLRRGLNREKEEDVAELTRDSLTAMGRRR